jgi:poly(A) polymerase
LIFTHPSRARGTELLAETGLLEVVLPEVAPLLQTRDQWSRSVSILNALETPTFSMSLAALLRELQAADEGKSLARIVFERWKLSTDELEGVEKLLRDESIIRTASRQPWPKLQRILVAPRIHELLGYCEAIARVVDGSTAQIGFCLAKLALPTDDLDPPPLITGNDLKQLGIPPGPAYRELLDGVRDAQLEKRILTREDAARLLRTLIPEP